MSAKGDNAAGNGKRQPRPSRRRISTGSPAPTQVAAGAASLRITAGGRLPGFEAKRPTSSQESRASSRARAKQSLFQRMADLCAEKCASRCLSR